MPLAFTAARIGRPLMLLQPSNELEHALRDLSQLADGEHVYWLGYKEKNGVITVEKAVQVPGSQTNRQGRFGFDVDPNAETRIVAELQASGLRLASIHNHPAEPKEQPSKEGRYVKEYELSTEDVRRFNYFRNISDSHFLLEQYTTRPPSPTVTLTLGERYSCAKLLGFALGHFRCELVLYRESPQGWMPSDLGLAPYT